MLHRLPVMLAALWWGSLTALGAYVVPLAFSVLGAPKVAGMLAARYFTAQNYLALICGIVLLAILNKNKPFARMESHNFATILIVIGMLAALLAEFAAAPRIAAASLAGEATRLWHGIGSGLLLAQWLCAGALLWQLSADRQNGASE
jgi:hypothetical protein